MTEGEEGGFLKSLRMSALVGFGVGVDEGGYWKSLRISTLVGFGVGVDEGAGRQVRM